MRSSPRRVSRGAGSMTEFSPLALCRRSLRRPSRATTPPRSRGTWAAMRPWRCAARDLPGCDRRDRLGGAAIGLSGRRPVVGDGFLRRGGAAVLQASPPDCRRTSIATVRAFRRSRSYGPRRADARARDVANLEWACTNRCWRPDAAASHFEALRTSGDAQPGVRFALHPSVPSSARRAGARRSGKRTSRGATGP